MENQDNGGKTQKGGTKGYHDVISIPMVDCIRKKWLETMKKITGSSVDHIKGP